MVYACLYLFILPLYGDDWGNGLLEINPALIALIDRNWVGFLKIRVMSDLGDLGIETCFCNLLHMVSMT